MSILIGFKRAKIQPLDKTGQAEGDVIVVEGTQDEGAAQEANISGLSAEPIRVYGSNVAYYVAQKGTGDVTVELKLLDLPSAAEDRILGYKTDATLKAQFIGKDTEPPYCAVTLESEDSQGNVAMFGFFKGKFSKSDIALKTREGGNFEPTGESYSFAAIESDRGDASQGNTMVKFIGKGEDAKAVEALTLATAG